MPKIEKTIYVDFLLNCTVKGRKEKIIVELDSESNKEKIFVIVYDENKKEISRIGIKKD